MFADDFLVRRIIGHQRLQQQSVIHHQVTITTHHLLASLFGGTSISSREYRPGGAKYDAEEEDEEAEFPWQEEQQQSMEEEEEEEKEEGDEDSKLTWRDVAEVQLTAAELDDLPYSKRQMRQVVADAYPIIVKAACGKMKKFPPAKLRATASERHKIFVATRQYHYRQVH
jgi:hypothetical protein